MSDMPHAPIAQHLSTTNEWFTPKEYVDAARKVMGNIDLDPASCADANRHVCADHIFTLQDDGLSEPWWGCVWLNPPYGKTGSKSNQDTWSAKLIAEYQAGNIEQAVLLVNAVPDRKWFARLWAYQLCFTDHRIRFLSPQGEYSQPTHGNAFVYLGPNAFAFAEEFSRFGVVVDP